MMRVPGAYFCVVCMEAMLRQLYRTVRPIDAVEPDTHEIVLGKDGTSLVKAYPMKPRDHFLEATWTLERLPDPEQRGPTAVTEEPKPMRLPAHGRHVEPDGRVVEMIRLTGAELDTGVYRLRVTVRDPTPWVLRDEEGLLSQTRDWTLKLEERAKADDGAGKRK
jgi:hypothetical protein